MNALTVKINSLLALLYPNLCQICRVEEATPAEGYICRRCCCGTHGVKSVEPPFCQRCGLPFEGDINVSFRCANCHDRELHFRSARAGAVYSGVLKEAIHGYKYNNAVWFEPFLTRILVAAAKPLLAAEDWDYLIPIPLHWTKRIERSFNQANRLAGALSKATGIPVNRKLLQRAERTRVQARLSRDERAANVKRAFRFRGKQNIRGARIVLIDDVLTTGATASACAKILIQNGAALVDVWTVARHVLR